MHKKSITLIFLTFFATALLSAGSMIVPRKVHMLSTQYFDILFSEESARTAKLIADNGDSLFENAAEKYGLEHTFRMPVIISPDSDCFSITYSPIPYNRILIYEAAYSQDDSVFSDIMLGNFYNEVVHAVCQSIKGKTAYFLSKIIPVHAFQPVFLTNMPFSLLEGIQQTEESSYYEGQGKLNDKFFLQILSQAKLEGTFPTALQAYGAMDIYPDKYLSKAAGSAFTAYLIQAYGFEKLYEFWQECGNFHFYFHKGIFYKIYGDFLENAWSDFADSIPLPQELEHIQYLEEASDELLPNDNRGLYTNILSSPYGLIWYDDIRHEVSIYNPDSFFKGRQLLFLADDVTKLSLSSNGRFLAVSFIKNGLRDNLKKNCVWIFDIKRRIFLHDSYSLKDACFVQYDDFVAIAGIENKTNHSSLNILSCSSINNLVEYEQTGVNPKNKKELLYTRDFNSDVNLFSLSSPSKTILFGILNHDNRNELYKLNLENTSEQLYTILDINGKPINAVKNLNVTSNPYNSTFKDKLLVFQYIAQDDEPFSKFGFFFLNHLDNPAQLWLLCDSISGGINYPIIKESELYYSSIKYNHGEIRKITFDKLNFKNASFIEQTEPEIQILNYKDDTPLLTKITDEKKKIYFLDDYQLKKYHPINYMYNGTIIPMMPVYELSIRDGVEYWPGLGLSFLAQTDPFSNNALILSVGFGFLPHSFEKLTNPTEKEIIERQEEEIMKIRDFSTSVLFQNTSTPIDLSLGCLYKSTEGGDYLLRTLLGGKWTLPLGMNFRKLTMEIESDFTISTKYREVYKADIYPALPNFTPLDKAYQDYLFSYMIEYSNIHQFGFSPYEQRGLSAGLIANFIWDYNLPDDGKSKPIFNSKIFKTASQINLGFYANARIPQLLPFKDNNNTILCFPTEVNLELFKTNGTAFDVSTEILIFGKEIQNGFSLLNFYFSRIGIKLGYDYSLVYDINSVALPDLRNFAYLYNAFLNTTIDDSFYIIADFGFTPVIGLLSSASLKTDFKFTFHLHSSAFKFSVNFEYKL